MPGYRINKPEAGPHGKTGYSIKSAQLVGDELILNSTSGGSYNVGNVKGATGSTGATGATGATGSSGSTAAISLTGDTLAGNVRASSLTSVGTLTGLTVATTIVGGVTGSAGTVLNPNLTGEVTTSGLTATLTNSAVIGKVLTGYTSGAGTVANTDTILQAIQKLNGNAGGAAAAGDLTGATLAAGVTASSLTSVGTLASLTTSGTFTLDATALISSSSATALAIKTAVPAGTGVTPTLQIICPSTTFTLTSGTASQVVFNTPQDTISLQAATTYMVEGQYLLQTGTTSHTTTISFVSSIASTEPTFAYTTIGSAHSSANAATNTQQTSFFEAITGGIVVNASTLPRTIISFKGILRTTDAGNLVPRLLFSAAPGGTCLTLVGSYLKFYPIGLNTINSVGTAIG